MNITKNELIGQWAYVNEQVWPIEEMRIEIKQGKAQIYIRGAKSYWYNANSCFINEKQECEMYLEIMNDKLMWERMKRRLIVSAVG